MQDLKKKAFKGFAWDYIGSYVNHGITFIISIFLARLLSPEDFGLLGMSMVFISLAQIFLDMGFGSAIIQKTKLEAVELSTVFFINLSVGIILFILFFFTASLIGGFYKNEYVTELVRVLSVLFIINSLAGIPSALLRKNLKFRELAIRNVTSSIIGGIIGITMAFKGFGVWSLVAKSIVGSFLNMIFVWIFSKYRIFFAINFKAVRGLWNYGNRLFLSTVINVIYDRLDILVIGKLFTPAALGFYNRAKSFNFLIVHYSSQSIGNILFPSLSQIKEDREKVTRVLKKTLHVVSFIAFGLVGLFWVTGSDLIIFLFGEKWEPSTLLFKLMLLKGYSYPVSAILVKTIAALGNSTAFLKLEILKKGMLTLAFPIGFVWGINGFLIAMAVTGLFGTLLNMLYVEKDLSGYNIYDQIKDVFGYLPITVIAIITVIPIHSFLPEILWLRILTDAVIFLVVYLLINILRKNVGFRHTKEMVSYYWPSLIRKIKGIRFISNH